jgi:hypothetical protein
MTIRARGVTATGLVVEVLDPLHGNAHHGLRVPEILT